MTREQYYEMAENFAKYGNNEVEYKVLNLHPTKSNSKKYNPKKGTLIGVGILGNAEHFIIEDDFGGRVAIHYRNITWPTTFKFQKVEVKVVETDIIGANFAYVYVDGKEVHSIRTTSKGALAAELAYHDALRWRLI